MPARILRGLIAGKNKAKNAPTIIAKPVKSVGSKVRKATGDDSFPMTDRDAIHTTVNKKVRTKKTALQTLSHAGSSFVSLYLLLRIRINANIETNTADIAIMKNTVVQNPSNKTISM